jgi:hypothetical protein
MAGAEVIGLVNGDGASLGRTGSDAVRALVCSLHCAPTINPADTNMRLSAGSIFSQRITPEVSASSSA